MTWRTLRTAWLCWSIDLQKLRAAVVFILIDGHPARPPIAACARRLPGDEDSTPDVSVEPLVRVGVARSSSDGRMSTLYAPPGAWLDAALMASKVRVAPARVPTKPSRVQVQQPKTNPFYLTPEWRSLVADIIRERGRHCELCGRSREGGIPIRIYGDHIIELRDGGDPLDRRGVQLVCSSCHTKKTLRERARRMAAIFSKDQSDPV